MDATREYHTKWSQKEKDCITYMWNLKYETNQSIYETETGTQGTDNPWWLPRETELGEKWSGGLGLADVSFYI